jgi:hypothetical protein
MLIEEPIENPPPVVNSAVIPAFARDYVDLWGNFKKAPVRAIEQSHGADFIRFYVYRAELGFYFSYRLKLRKLIYQREANINDPPEATEEKAIRAAHAEIVALVNKYSKKLLEVFLTFDKVCYNQPELF